MDRLSTGYAGRRWPLFLLALKSGLLTVLTLGFYRFWMKTRLRRYYWSAIRPGGLPLEYVGEPLEKLLGFLVAVVFMAFYLGIVNLVLMFFSFSLFQTNMAGYALSFVGVLPVLFFARYRARRYILARTRWRGIRFGLEPGAWGYAWRAALWWLVALASLGILWPLKAFKLEKYRTDHTYFGSERFEQGGRWTMLLRAMRPLYLAVGASALVGGLAWWRQEAGWLWAWGVTLPWALWALAAWQARAFKALSETKRLGGISFAAEPRPGPILGVYLGGYLLAVLVIGVVLVGVGVVIGLLSASGVDIDLGALMQGDVRGMPGWLGVMLVAVGYFAVFLLWNGLTQVFVTLPLARHFAGSVSIGPAHELAHVRQRARDEFAEAEGFADALDVGAALGAGGLLRITPTVRRRCRTGWRCI
ncbi:MAG TPA: DUF898 family protein [Aliiroseovarius sp.]|nr:DUF898 family protein [Aliiroseovarius sp.]